MVKVTITGHKDSLAKIIRMVSEIMTNTENFHDYGISMEVEEQMDPYRPYLDNQNQLK